MSAKFILESAPQPKIAKTLKLSIFAVHCHSKSSMMTPLESSSLVFVLISSMSLSICNWFHAKRANSGKITTF